MSLGVGVDRGRFKLAVSALLLAALAAIGPSSVAAVTGTGIIVGPWSCPPDQKAGLTFNVTGSGDVTIDMYYMGAGLFLGQTLIKDFTIYPGYTTIYPPSGGRSIAKFSYSTFGTANLRTWIKSCK